jgi:hypothetical protein
MLMVRGGPDGRRNRPRNRGVMFTFIPLEPEEDWK